MSLGLLSMNQQYSTHLWQIVSIIQEGTNVNQWKYNDRKNNLADHASRGLFSSELAIENNMNIEPLQGHQKIQMTLMFVHQIIHFPAKQ